jgi:hypothetical protein
MNTKFVNIILIFIIIIIVSFIINLKNKENFSNKHANALHKYFESIYVITLPKRKEYIKNVMDNIELKPIYFDAIKKETIDITQLSRENYVDINYKKGNGRIACHLSHLTVLKDFLKTTNKRCFIFEDDVKKIDIPLSELNSKIDNIMDNLPYTFDIIYFGRCWDKCHKQNYISDNLVRTYFPQCRHSYGVTRKGAEIIIKKSIPLIDKGGDQNIAILIENGELEAYAVTPNLFFQNRDVLGSNLNNLDSLNECRNHKKINNYKSTKNNTIEHFTSNSSNSSYNNKIKARKTYKLSLFKPIVDSVVMTTYFCGLNDSHKNYISPCNDIRYIGNWYFSMKQLKLNGVIFHNNLSKEFVKKYTTDYIKFVKVDSSKFQNSLNDERFIIYYKYLLKHKNIKNIFMTDGNDITVVKDPFMYLKKFSNKILVGSEEDDIDNKLDWFIKPCLDINIRNYLIQIKDNTILNAGIIGGKRKNILNFLKKISNYFLNNPNKECNINMHLVNYILYKDFKDTIKYGGKLNSRFKFYENFRKDIYFIHK